ncbi:MAG: N-carbamoylputrescine amidase [Alphaproteobacteria bacterium]|jgi:N-carbamoylputrescine amidase|nr:N-carbamoylputrescine amidase [Alphaproteobacteria bacterium]
MSGRLIKIAALQEKALPRAPVVAKLERTTKLIEAAAKDGAKMVLCGELCTTDYDRCFGQKDWALFDEAEPVPGPSTNVIASLAKKLGIYIIFPMFEKGAPGIYFNSAITIGPDGNIIDVYRKTQVAGMRALEKMYFRAGQKFSVHQTTSQPNAQFGTIICHDRQYPEPPRIIAMLGAEIMFCPVAAPRYAHGPHWELVNRSRALDNGMFCVYANRIGQEGNNDYFGESMIINPHGEIIAFGGDQENTHIIAECDLDLVDDARKNCPTLRDLRVDLWMKYYQPAYDTWVSR